MKLTQINGNEFHINSKKSFIKNKINKKILDKCFEFASNMVFGTGHHRSHRSGGQYSRKNGELFANTFQGKIAEFVTYNKLVSEGLVDLEEPDTGVYGEGVWDDVDLEYKNKKINIKSAAFFSNLLLLEKKDWNSEGQYIPNINNTASQDYDYFLMVRIKPDIKSIIRCNNLLYLDITDTSKIKELILKENWFFDFGGVCNQTTIKYVIANNYLIPQNGLLNGKIKMDADNYYIQSADLKGIGRLITDLKKY